MPWLYLLIAGVLEIAWAIGLKHTDGFTRVGPPVGTAAAMLPSIAFLGLALRTIPVGTGYAVWVGIGTVGVALLGMWLFREPATAIRLACIGLIVAGCVGLKVAG